MEQSKIDYMNKNGIVEFDKEAMIQKYIKEYHWTYEKAHKHLDKFKYHRIMPNGRNAFYSEEYIQNHSVEELEKRFSRYLED
jgi:hypothetical protein